MTEELETYTPISGMHCCCEELGDYVSKADYDAKPLPPEVEAVLEAAKKYAAWDEKVGCGYHHPCCNMSDNQDRCNCGRSNLLYSVRAWFKRNDLT